ncbi:MAG: multicopper oxidase family protein [Vicinamibacterales bacterium]
MSITSICLVMLVQLTPAAAQSIQPAQWNADVKLVESIDANPDPRIVEVALDAREADISVTLGERVRAWTYNGTLPGPLIRARVGDRLIVHFTNHLGVNTTVHWHGVRVPNAMDGVPEHTQPAVSSGQHFTYDFVLRDAGLFWYHPHVMSAAQVGFGLYGALLVDDPDIGVGVEDEAVLVLSDISIVNGDLESPASGGNLASTFGREGTRVLVNGRSNPSLLVRDAAPQRWRIVNAARSRYFLLDLEGEPFLVIGSDGGLNERAERKDSLVVAPGERLDVIVTPRRPPDGEPRVLRSGLFNRGFGSTEFRQVESLLTLRFDTSPPWTAPLAHPPPRHIEPLDLEHATRVQVDLTFSNADGANQYGINGVAFSGDSVLSATVGDTQIWTITNRTRWSHPFHLHGFFFQLLDERGRPVRPLAWKDTVDVPFEQTVNVAVRFDDRPGMWMYHCHVLDHADIGLMGMLLVRPR